MTTVRRLLSVLILTWLFSPLSVAAATVMSAVRPLPGAVLTAFDPPEVSWGSGHRGVDLAGQPGESVRAAAAGTVAFAGMLAGRGVVVVDHGEIRTTYEPVVAVVAVGRSVARGETIGRLQAGHPSCPGSTCLHWGARIGEDYLDPLSLLAPSVRLLPASATPAPSPPRALAATAAGGLVRPADGPVTSGFGMRRHPITGIWKLHDGTDFGAPCGAPIRAAASGTVATVIWTSGYGNRLVLDSGMLRTSYNHAQRYVVPTGSHVEAGQVIGYVGATGLATGCHLHVQVWLDGQLVDPMSVLT